MQEITKLSSTEPFYLSKALGTLRSISRTAQAFSVQTVLIPIGGALSILPRTVVISNQHEATYTEYCRYIIQATTDASSSAK